MKKQRLQNGEFRQKASIKMKKFLCLIACVGLFINPAVSAIGLEQNPKSIYETGLYLLAKEYP